ncbi:MAG: lipoate--protein ligase family protein [Pisciglobus halotolerans]|nr:lipoate--protein ligase family protein [Pisciglobus halotolerans]
MQYHAKPKDFLSHKTFHLYDSKSIPFKNQTISHFALTDSLMQFAGKRQQHLLHFWPTKNLVILGMMDTKLPYLEDGLAVLKQAKKDFIVRNSGGLAVVSDEGVLNFSIILPEKPDERLSINEGYEVMLQLIRSTFASFGKNIEAYEIEESYCPGEFDLSIDGKKFAGIAQRRLKNGVAVMIYISVNGNQKKRAELLHDFYQQGLKGESVKWHFPDVHAKVMDTLENLLGTSLTVVHVKKMILQTFLDYHNTVVDGIYSEEIIDSYEAAYQKMIRRNEQMLGDQLDRRLLE